MPNPSFNLTLCGGPILGFKSITQNSPTTKCRLTQTLGNTKPTYRKSLRASPVEYKVIGYDAQFFVEKERMQQPQHSGAYVLRPV